MNRQRLCLLTLLLIFFGSCSSWKNALVTEGKTDDAVKNAVIDFLNSDRLSKKDTVFSIEVKEIDKNVLGISILGYPDRLLPSSRNRIGTNFPNFPTRYIEKNGKLFYWYDSQKTIDVDLISVLNKYHRIDSLNVNGLVGIPARLTGDSKKAAHYYFCISNLRNYKKIHTSIGLDSYPPPNLNCSN